MKMGVSGSMTGVRVLEMGPLGPKMGVRVANMGVCAAKMGMCEKFHSKRARGDGNSAIRGTPIAEP